MPASRSAITRALAPLVIGALALALAGCDEELGPPPAPEDTGPIVATVTPPRRPTRRFYLARTSERCEIFAQDEGDRTDPFLTPCPEYLRIGERIRIAGKTCILDNTAEPEREKPVVCPDPLTRFEKELRAAEN